MISWCNSWRAAVRIARRDAWRFKGRSLLVLAMIALPILGVSAADITIRSSELSTEQQLDRSLGSADARLTDAGVGGQPVYQVPRSAQTYQTVDDSDAVRSKSDTTDVPAAAPAGAKTITDSIGSAKIRTAYGLLDVEVRELDASDPMTVGIMDLDRGRFPRSEDEVVATDALLKTSGLHVGSRVTARGLATEFHIVGAYDLPDDLKAEQLNALPGTFLEPLAKGLKAAGRSGPGTTTTYLVTVGGPFTWDMVKQTNTKGVVAESRAVKLHPPADSDVPLYVVHPDWNRTYSGSAAEKAALLAAVATVVGLAVLEICLLAGPAFAVGARRSRRQLGLVGANGGDRRHIRAVVLAGGLVIGVAAAVTGTVLAIGLTAVLRPVLEDYVGRRFGGLELRPMELLGVGLLAVVTGLLASIVPAVTASRESVLASLTGRRGVRRANRVLPVVGLAAICLGAGIAFFGSMESDNITVVGGGSAIAELGIVALTPSLVGAFGRLARYLPLSPRLALRDAVRNRGRTAPAVAAVLAAVAGTVAVATYTASDDFQQRNEYRAVLPYGTVAVGLDVEGGRDLAAVRAAVEKRFPVTARADVARLLTGRKTCDVWSSDEGCGRVELVVPRANDCPLHAEDAESRYTAAERRTFAGDWRCAVDRQGSVLSSESGLLVGGPDVLTALAIKDPAAGQALREGRTVLFAKQYEDHGRITLRLVQNAQAPVAEGKGPVGPEKVFPAFLAAEGTESYGVIGIMPPSAAGAAGIATVPQGSYFTNDRVPTSRERQELDGDLARLGVQPTLHVEEGYVSKTTFALLAMTVFAGLVTVGAAGIATGLAQADAEPDLRTLTAIGAAPRVRRTLSGFQCGVVAVMGVVLGSVAGILPAVGLRRSQERQQLNFYHRAIDQGWPGGPVPHVPVVAPWGTLAALLVAVPLGSALLAALVTRSRTAHARRAKA